MKIIEFVNKKDSETFIVQHLVAIKKYTKIDINWFAVQEKHAVAFEKECKIIGLGNFHKFNLFEKIVYKIIFEFILRKKNWKKQLLINQIQKYSPDLVHFHFASIGVQYYQLLKELQIPYTVSLRGADINVFPNTITGYKEKLINMFENAKGIHAVNDNLFKKKNNLTTNTTTNFKVIRTAISENWKNTSRNPLKNYIIAVGRLTHQKGFNDLILASKIVINVIPDLKLVIIGDGEKKDEFEFMIRDLNLSNNIILAGKKTHSEIIEEYSHAQLMVASYLYEGFPNVVAESWYSKLPVISTNFDGHENIITNENCLICEMNNPKSLANAIIYGLQNPDEMKLKAENAYNFAIELFDENKHARSFNDFWKEAIKNG